MNLDKMTIASHLLPDPGGEVVRSLVTELQRLRKIIRSVVNIVDPECPDPDAYIAEHCSLPEVVQRKIAPPTSVMIRGLDVPIQDLREDVEAAYRKGLRGEYAFLPETVESLLNVLIRNS